MVVMSDGVIDFLFKSVQRRIQFRDSFGDTSDLSAARA